ncbi:two component transcriptional regulator, winged helix family [Coriobacterium glomerans PW2]|uniref:Two component transcriptional regulator, winged helix family n=1 Tax=Coriobacterium glomerans (strain ATCC 49209 / DSM 20642 / JCM 10262 / PW2) TaxID=700015 RepID=F2N745_CORGP|nr:response regulator transcription factor [Coriobacterium glomerans]AEB06384.1 two component transcriptional regulator, winged helix family [Coriobacterium glomerans PW2]
MTSPARVLIIEDDADISQIVSTHLSRHGYSCTQAYSGSEARLLLERGDNAANSDENDATPIPFSVVICDLMLPGMPGEQLVELIRARDASAPIIVISARAAPSDKIDLLKLGADDYLAKPFDLDELLARVEVQLRHRRAPSGTAPGAHGALGFRSWELDTEARTLTAHGEPVALTRIEFNIVEILMRHPRRVFTKQELFEGAWGEPYAADDNTINVHVSNIRTKLRASGTADYIRTVWGMGFKLVEE